MLERVDEVPGDAEPIHEVRVAQIPIGGERRRVLADDRLPELHARVVRIDHRGQVVRGDEAVEVRARLRGGEQEGPDVRHVREERRRAPADLRRRDERRDRLARSGDDEQRVGALRLQREDLLRHRLIGGVEAFLVDDEALLRGQALLQARDVVLSEGVVLVDDADLRVRHVLRDVPAVQAALARIVRLPADRVRLRRALARLVCAEAPVRVARGEEHLRHLVGVRVTPGRETGRRPQVAHEREDLVLLDELLYVGHGLSGVVRVVHDGEVDLAAVDAAVVVHVREVRGLRGRNRLVRRRDTRQREGPADVDRRLRDAGIGTVRAERGGRRHGREREPGENRQQSALPTHQPS